MAVLSEQDRQEVRHSLGKHFSRLRKGIPLDKDEWKEVVDAADQWIEDNAASYNLAIPLPARTELDSADKALIFFFVANKRYEVI